MKKIPTFKDKLFQWFWNNRFIVCIIILYAILSGIGDSLNSYKAIKEIYGGCVRSTSFFPDSGFNILIIPFLSINKSNNEDYGFEIKKRLLKMNKNDSLGLNICYDNTYNPGVNFNSDSAQYLSDKHKADLIIYGSYRGCEGDSNEVCINHLCSNKIPIKDYIIQDEYSPMKASISSIRSGNLQGNIDFIIYYIVGISEYEKENYLKSKEKFNFIIHNIEKKHSGAFFYVGLCDIFLSDYCESIIQFTKALQLNPKNDDALNGRGVAKMLQKDYKGAIKDFTKSLEINPKNEKAFYNRGVIKHKQGDNKGAIKDYTKSLEINPKGDYVFHNRGLAKYELRDYKGAIKDLAESLEINPKNDHTFCTRGITRFKQANYKGAIKDFTKAIEIDSNNARYYLFRGICYYKLGENDNFCIDITTAKKLGNEKSATLYEQECLKQ